MLLVAVVVVLVTVTVIVVVVIVVVVIVVAVLVVANLPITFELAERWTRMRCWKAGRSSPSLEHWSEPLDPSCLATLVCVRY